MTIEKAQALVSLIPYLYRTRREAAAAIGVNLRTLRNWQVGRHKPKARTARRLQAWANAHGICYDEASKSLNFPIERAAS